MTRQELAKLLARHRQWLLVHILAFRDLDQLFAGMRPVRLSDVGAGHILSLVLHEASAVLADCKLREKRGTQQLAGNCWATLGVTCLVRRRLKVIAYMHKCLPQACAPFDW